MHIKIWLHYSLLKRLASYKVCLCFIVLSVTVCTAGYICLFRGDLIFVDFVSFLSMIIYEILFTWCLKVKYLQHLAFRYKNYQLVLSLRKYPKNTNFILCRNVAGRQVYWKKDGVWNKMYQLFSYKMIYKTRWVTSKYQRNEG